MYVNFVQLYQYQVYPVIKLSKYQSIKCVVHVYQVINLEMILVCCIINYDSRLMNACLIT